MNELQTENTDNDETRNITKDCSTSSYGVAESTGTIALNGKSVVGKSDETTSTKKECGLLKLMTSRLYVLHLVYLCTISLQLVYFVGSLEGQLVHLSRNNENTVSDHVNMFGYIQMGVLFVTPLIGILFDRDILFNTSKYVQLEEKIENEKRKLKQCIAPLAVTIGLSLALCFLGLFKSMVYELPKYIVYMVVRGFLYASQPATQYESSMKFVRPLIRV